jgi:hypothetical protein
VVTKEFAVKIDTELSQLHNQRWTIISKIEGAEEDLKFYQKHYPTRIGEIAKYEGKIYIFRADLRKVNGQIRDLDAIYDQDPWTRAFLVLASNGHVHSSLNCSTCFPTTRYQWLIQYSNDDEATIVDDAGQDACTICYPSAPAETLNRPSRIVTADKVAKEKARVEREAKKAAKLAKEKADAPTASGEPLAVPSSYSRGGFEYIRTERTAVSEWNNLQYTINNEVVTHYYNGEPHTEESIQHQKDLILKAQDKADIICKSLAEKHGVSFDQQLKILQDKYKKRGNR